MISCIICSCNIDMLTEVQVNISKTIGCDFELIVLDNSQCQFSIFSAYNEGVRRSKGDILCFMHEDIIFHTQNWGNIIFAYFEKHPLVGMIGVAGTHFLSSIPSGWWEAEVNSYKLLQGEMNHGVYENTLNSFDMYKSSPTQVVSIDGLWMCIPRNIFSVVRWDDLTFQGFHGYDIDMSLQIWEAGYEVHVIWDVLLEHKSKGKVDMIFYETYNVLWKKWSNQLPSVKGINMSITEKEARTEIVKLKRELRENVKYIESLKKSYAYRITLLFIKSIKKFIQLFK